jgi:hypothetical protein
MNYEKKLINSRWKVTAEYERKRQSDLRSVVDVKKFHKKLQILTR